jgi:hypothetical protein
VVTTVCRFMLAGGKTWRGREDGTILMVPSHELEANVSFETRFHDTEYTSRLCSCHDCTGKLFSAMSNSFTDPSPHATTIWFSCASDHAVS